MRIIEIIKRAEEEDREAKRKWKRMNYPKYQCKNCKTKYWFACRKCPTARAKTW